MASARHLVVVAGRDPHAVDDLATALRAAFAVRTAYSPGELLGSLDDEVDVVLVTPPLADTVPEERLRNRGLACEVAVLADDDADVPADRRTVARSVPPESLRERIRTLAERAAYRAKLERYYDLAARRAELIDAGDREDDLDDVEERLDRLREELAAALGDLDDVTAFDVALRFDDDD